MGLGGWVILVGLGMGFGGGVGGFQGLLWTSGVVRGFLGWLVVFWDDWWCFEGGW